MKQLITGLLTSALIFSATACGGSPGAKLESLAKEVCACKDTACAEGVNEKIEAALKELEEKYPNGKGAPADLMTSLGKSMGEAGKCRGELMKAEKK